MTAFYHSRELSISRAHYGHFFLCGLWGIYSHISDIRLYHIYKIIICKIPVFGNSANVPAEIVISPHTTDADLILSELARVTINKDRDTRCNKSLRHVAATGCCNKSPRVTCENHCHYCDRISSLRSVAQIQTGLNSCDISQRQTKRKRLVAAVVQTRGLVAATCRRDLSHRVSRS